MTETLFSGAMTPPAQAFELKPIRMTNLRVRVYEELRQAIIAGYFKTGTKLNERQLAAQLGISTSPVKEVLRRLEVEGLVRTEPRRGSFVTFSARQAEEMTLARAAIESVITGMAARKASDTDLEQLQSTLETMRAAVQEDDVQGLARSNEEFHAIIRRASGCTYLIHLLNAQRAFTQAARLTVLSRRDVRRESLREHKAILDAIMLRDGEKAEALMRAHIIDAGKTHIELVFSPSAEAAFGEHS